MFSFKSKFRDINEIFNVVQITEEYIIIKENNEYLKVYIYEVEPIILLDLNESTMENIILQYKEFLRQINFDFQVLVINKEISFKEYIKKVFNDKLNSTKIYSSYINDMEIKFKNENIFETVYYIIVKIKDNNMLNVDTVDNSIKILSKIGCKVNRIIDKNKLTKILNNSINKEW